MLNNPLKTLDRIVKYARRGVSFSQVELFKVFAAWEELKGETRDEIRRSVFDSCTYGEEDCTDDEGGTYEYGHWYDDDDFWLGE